jgi:hypothetical protein
MTDTSKIGSRVMWSTGRAKSRLTLETVSAQVPPGQMFAVTTLRPLYRLEPQGSRGASPACDRACG